MNNMANKELRAEYMEIIGDMITDDIGEMLADDTEQDAESTAKTAVDAPEADSDNNTQEQGTEADKGKEKPPKLFTKEQVNEIVKKRLSREREKQNKAIQDSETFSEDLKRRARELEIKERKFDYALKAQIDGIPLALIDTLNLNSDTAAERAYKTLVDTWKLTIDEAVEDGVLKRLRHTGKTPTKYKQEDPKTRINGQIKDIFMKGK